MGTLHAFLNPEKPENKEIIISNRFKDDKGNPVPFIIRAISQEENEALRKRATRTYKDKTGETVREFDSAKFARIFTIAGTVQPDFQASDLCEAYDVVDPEKVLGKMLLAGEYSKLTDAIMDLSGLSNEAMAMEAEEAKN